MPTFKYKARDKAGQTKEGIVKADTQELASLHIKQVGLTLVSLKEKSEEKKMALVFTGNIKTKDLAIFTTQMHALLVAGLSVVAGLRALENSATHPIFRENLKRIREVVEGGGTLADAFAEHKKVFDDLFCNMIRAGEASGSLAEVLQRLAFSIEKEWEIKRKIRSAMSYPIVLVVTILAAVLVLGFFVIPRFATLFAAFNAELPLPTRILLKFNYLLSHYWLWGVIFAGIMGFLFLRGIRTPTGKKVWDQFKLRVYIFGPLFLKIYMARFSYLVSTLIRSGISVIDTFDLAAKTTDNVILSKAIGDIREKVRQGRGIASSMKEEVLFPGLVIQMVEVGEESGRIEDLLDQVGHFYEREADYTISNLTTLIEPLLLFCIAGIVLIMALGIFLPLWNMYSVISH